MRSDSPHLVARPVLSVLLKSALGGLLLGGLMTGCKPSAPVKTAAPPEPVILKLGNKAFTTDEFFQSFTKNQIAADSARRPDIREYFDLYTNLKLKVLAAESQGLDTTEATREELATYRQQLSQNYLNDKELIEAMTAEAYERMKEEVNASHLLIAAPEDASPADTLAAWSTIQDLRRRLLSGENFETLARQYSKDPTVNSNGGNLGYFSVFQLIYPLETAAYTTPVGSISQPVRSRSGYHLLKVNDRRASRGKIRVAHIRVQVSSQADEQAQQAAEKRINDVYQKLQRGESFEDLAREYSDDRESRATGGVLPVREVGRWVPEFENAAFALSEPGSYSKPFKTRYGWHIVRLLERIPTEPFDVLAPIIRPKIMTDTRGEIMRRTLVQRLRNQYAVVENPDVRNRTFALADSNLLQGRWKVSIPADLTNKTLVTVDKKPHSVNEFVEYVTLRQQPRPVGSSSAMVMQRLYTRFVDDKLVAAEEANLESKYPDFKALMSDIRDGVLLSQVMETNVWDKSLTDTTGQRLLWEQNKEKYRYPNRAVATVLVGQDEATVTQATEMLSKKPFELRRSVVDLTYPTNQTTLGSKQRENLFDLLVIMIKNPDYVVEVIGSADASERDTVSAARIRNVVNYLTMNGIPLARVMEKDYAKFRPGVKGEQARRVTFRLYSNSRADVARTLNAKNPNALILTEGYFAKGQSTDVDAVEWKPGTTTLRRDGKVVRVLIERIEPPRVKTFEEAKGAVINDYQAILEKQLLDRLRQRFPVHVNDEEIKKLAR